MSRLGRALAAVLAIVALFPLATRGESAEAARGFGATPLDDVLYWAGQERRCGLSTHELAALMLAPTFPETGAPPTSAPSPMTLSRWDNQSGLHSFESSRSYRKAFWHPGIGPWQFDSAGLGTYDSARQRIDTFTAAAHAADTMAQRWCASSGTDRARRAYVWAPWYGCGSTTCQTIFGQIFDGNRLVGLNTRAGVTRLGGMQARTCQGPGRSGSFRCWRVDPNRAEGHTAFAAAGFGPAPITAPFYVYTAGGREYRHWLRADTGYDTGIWATRPLGANARSGLTWRAGQPLVVQGPAPPPAPPPEPGPGGFWDVDEGDWYVDGLLWAVENGVMTGFGDDTFRPRQTLNRAQAVMALWRAQGRPTATVDHRFRDVPASAWYDAGLDWAAEQGIVSGYPDRTFRPANPLNRAQYVRMLWRVARRPVPDQRADFADAERDHWYATAMSWAVERGYMVGFPDDTFRAMDAMTRSQTVMALWRGRQFDDVAVTEWYAPSVDWARYRGVVDGYPDHTYRPDRNVNRAQIAMILFETMDAPPGSPAHGFVDVASTAWFGPGLDWVAANRVVTGYPDGSYRADQPVNRAQLLMMLWRLAGAPAVADPHGLTDVPDGAWYEAAARWAAAHGILDGVASGTLAPTRAADRGEVAALLHNLAASSPAWSSAVTPPTTVLF